MAYRFKYWIPDDPKDTLIFSTIGWDSWEDAQGEMKKRIAFEPVDGGYWTAEEIIEKEQ